MWIHTLAMCKSRELARTFSLPFKMHLIPCPDQNLEHIFQVTREPSSVSARILCLLSINPEHTPSHSQWISNVLLHLVWANRTRLDCEFLQGYVPEYKTKALPLSATLNRLLVWCVFLGSSVEEEVLEIQDKSYDISSFFPSLLTVLFASDHMEEILYLLSQAIRSAIIGTGVQCKCVPHVLYDLIGLETRPSCLTEIAYNWCSVIYETRESLGDWKGLLLASLEIGFPSP